MRTKRTKKMKQRIKEWTEEIKRNNKEKPVARQCKCEENKEREYWNYQKKSVDEILYTT